MTVLDITARDREHWQSLEADDNAEAMPPRLRLDGSILPIFDLAALDGPPPPPREWIVRDYIPKGEVTLFTGPGGAGKSLLAQQMATCLATGKPMLGVPTVPTKTLYITAEDDQVELHRRQRNIAEAIGWDALSGRLFLSSLRGKLENALVTFDRDGTLEKTSTYSLLHDTIAATGAGLVVLDNVAHLFAGNENDRGQVTAFVNLLYSLVRRTGAAIVLIGHPNKSGDAYSGSTAWLNAVRSQIEIDRVRDDSGAVLDPDARVLRLGKANYARAGVELAFRWHDHAFVRDEDLPADTAKELREAQRAQAGNTIFLNCLRARMALPGREVGASVGPNYAPARFAEMTEAKGLSKAELTRAMERLFHTKEITTREVKRKGNETKTIIVEGTSEPSELPSEPLPNTASEPVRTTFRTVPGKHPIPKGIDGAGPPNGPPPLPEGDRP